MKNMIRKTVTCLVLLMMSIAVFAKDIIVTNDAQKIEAKILEVSKSEIKYKELDNLDGPTFILAISEISSITYSNGKKVNYSQPEPISQPASNITDEDKAIEIYLLSGDIIKGQVEELKGDHVTYSMNGVNNTIQASIIEKVVFIKNGQVREYNGVSRTLTNTTSSSSSSSSSTSPQSSQSAQSAPTVSFPQSTETASSKPTPGRIYRDNGEYMYNDVYISSKEVARILKRENETAYKQWKKGEGMVIAGSIFSCIGGGLLLGSIFPSINKDYITAIGLDCGALVSSGIAIGLLVGSRSRYNRAIDIYNSKFDHAAVQLRWNLAPNSLSFAIAF